MVWHILGLVTMFAIAVAGVGTTWWLYQVGRYPQSWHRPMPVPKLIDKELFVIRGDDHIGLIT